MSEAQRKAPVYAMGGTNVTASQTVVTAIVHAHLIPTAQLSVFVSEDNQPINNAPNRPEKRGLARFQLTVEDAGGVAQGFVVTLKASRPVQHREFETQWAAPRARDGPQSRF